jgi:hypothetical protein
MKGSASRSLRLEEKMPAKKGARKKSNKKSPRRGAKSGLATRVDQTTKKAKRTVKKAARNVHSNAARAVELGKALIRAGELIQEGAAFLDSMAVRVSTGRERKSRESPSKRT